MPPRSPRSTNGAGSPTITVRGAREHNLKNINVELPRDKLIVFTGLSGSGKSSLAFDTIYAEGQRRYVESLSSYARQFLGQMDKPDVDVIEGCRRPSRSTRSRPSRNPRSTVGTITEVYDYLRLLYARIGIQHCPDHGTRLERQTPQQIVDRVLRAARRAPASRCWRPSSGAARASTTRCSRTSPAQGYVRARIDGEVVDIDEFLKRTGAAGPLRAAQDRGRRRPPRDARGHRPPADRLAGDGAQAGRRRRRAGDRPPRGRGGHRPRPADVQRAPRVPGRRAQLRGAGAAQLLVQLAVRRLPDLRRPRHDVRDRPRAGHPRPRPVAQRRRHRPVAHRPHPVLHADARLRRRRPPASTWTPRGARSRPSSRRSSSRAPPATSP